jgi:hypothetical protein
MSEPSQGDETGKNKTTGDASRRPLSALIKLICGWPFVWGLFVASFLVIWQFLAPSPKVVYLAALGFSGCCFLACHNICAGWKPLFRYGIPCVLSVVIWAVFYFILVPRVTPAIESAHPNLAPSLVIDSVSRVDVAYRYELLNNGEASAYNIRYEDSGEGFTHRVVESPDAWTGTELRPGEKMNLSPPPGAWNRKGKYFSKELSLSYESRSFSNTNQFQRRFRFIGDADSLRPGMILYCEFSSALPQMTDPFALLRDNFNSPCATIFLVFIETNRNGVFCDAFLENSNRGFSIDSRKRVVSFWNLTSSNRMDKLQLELKSSKSFVHDVMLCWATNGCLLGLDGVDVSSEGFR